MVEKEAFFVVNERGMYLKGKPAEVMNTLERITVQYGEDATLKEVIDDQQERTTDTL